MLNIEKLIVYTINNSHLIETKTRNPYFDNAKAILIILVVVGHIIEPFIDNNYCIKTIYTFIYTFHMPSFVLMSGYFSKYVKNLSKTELKYLLIYLIFTLIYSPFALNNLTLMIIFPFYVLWYLLSLVSWYVLLQFFKKIKHPIIISFFIAIIIGYIPYINEVMSLSRTFILFPFFLMGSYLKNDHFIKLTQMNKKVPILILIVIFISLWIVNFNHTWLYNSYSYIALGHSEFYAGLYRIALLLLFFILTSCFFSIVPNSFNKFTYIGRYTLEIFLLHQLIILTIYINLNVL